MNHTYIDRVLSGLQGQMRQAADSMDEFADANKRDGESFASDVREHANQLRGAANIAQTWRDRIFEHHKNQGSK